MTESVKYEIALKQHYKERRSHFVLSQDAQYGELLIPKGSLISRYDAFDNGESQVPFSLRGLQAVRFPHPVQVAGMWVTAMEPPRMELAWDQQIGPVMRFDPNEADGYGEWVYDTKRPTIACSRGDIVLLEIPLIDYDIQKNLVNLSLMELMHVFARVSGVFTNAKKVRGRLKLILHILGLHQRNLGFINN